MLLKSPDPAKHIVEDYDFSFVGGQILPITIDKAAGDTITFESAPVGVVIKLVAKPSSLDPSKMLLPEEITIFYTHLIAIQKRQREVVDMTDAQREEWREAMKAFAIPSSRPH